MRIFQPTISGSTNTTGSLVITGSLRVSEGITGSLFGTASWAINVVNGGGGSTNTGSLLTTASVNLNTITFTKGDGSTFPITINTGSGGGGSVGTLAQVTALGASTTTPITASIISASSFTGSLFGTASWALSASNAINARTASFVNNLNQNLSITGAVVLSGSALPELRVIGDTQFTGSINSLNGYTGSLFGTSSWAVSASRAISASFGPNIGNTNLTLTGNRKLNLNNYILSFDHTGDNEFNTYFNSLGINTTGSITAREAHIYGRNSDNPGMIYMFEAVNNGTSSIRLTAPTSLTNDVIFTLPSNTGSGDNYVLRDDGTGILYFTNQVPTASLAITSSIASRNLLTASVSLNTITFTKGDGSTFNLTINTGSGGGGPSYITPPFFTGSILYWDGTKVTGSNVMDYDGSSLNIDTGYFSVAPETQFGQDVTIFGLAYLESGARIYQDTIADAIVLEKVDPIGATSGSYGVGSNILRNFSSTGPTLTPGRIVYISGSGQWAEAIASADTTSTGVLGVVTTTANQNNILLNGIVRVSQSLAGFTNGSPVYLATSSAGTITQTPPSTVGHVARYVGYVLDSGSRMVYFNPDFTWIEL